MTPGSKKAAGRSTAPLAPTHISTTSLAQGTSLGRPSSFHSSLRSSVLSDQSYDSVGGTTFGRTPPPVSSHPQIPADPQLTIKMAQLAQKIWTLLPNLATYKNLTIQPISLQYESHENLTDEQKLIMAQAKTVEDSFPPLPTMSESEEMLVQALVEPSSKDWQHTFSLSSTSTPKVMRGTRSCDSHEHASRCLTECRELDYWPVMNWSSI